MPSCRLVFQLDSVARRTSYPTMRDDFNVGQCRRRREARIVKDRFTGSLLVMDDDCEGIVVWSRTWTGYYRPRSRQGTTWLIRHMQKSKRGMGQIPYRVAPMLRVLAGRGQSVCRELIQRAREQDIAACGRPRRSGRRARDAQ